MRTWYGLYQKQKDFSIGKSFTSSMIWGSQWDSMMNWMAKNSLIVGTYDSTKRNADGYYVTGSIRDASYANDKWNNIQDLEGCASEWTLESLFKQVRVNRGCYLIGTSGPSGRCTGGGPHPDDAGKRSSRLTLYIR